MIRYFKGVGIGLTMFMMSVFHPKKFLDFVVASDEAMTIVNKKKQHDRLQKLYPGGNLEDGEE